jgi:hypothetical protein
MARTQQMCLKVSAPQYSMDEIAGFFSTTHAQKCIIQMPRFDLACISRAVANKYALGGSGGG